MYTIPTKQALEERAAQTPVHMWPNWLPHTVISEGLLTAYACDEIIEEMMKFEPYQFPGCKAETRECDRPVPGVLQPLKTFAYNVNKQFWNFDIDPNCGAYMQTYREGDSYHIHTDGSYGQSRKLTVIALLSDEIAYTGGTLRITVYPDAFDIPRTRGTLIAFLPWLLHEVLPVGQGLRQTINMGFWGPPFK